MQICSLSKLPGWLRAGCLAASCHCAPRAVPPGPSSPASGPCSPHTPPTTAPSAAAITAAATHVLHAFGTSAPQASALRHFLSTTAAAAPSTAAMQMWTAVLWHIAAEGRALAYARLTHTLTPILPPVGAHEPCATISLPLDHPGRTLVLAKMPVARTTKIRWSTPISSGFSLAVQTTPDSRVTADADAPPIGAFVRYQGTAPQRVRFALGIMPEVAHRPGDAAGAAVAAARVASNAAAVQRAFAADGGLRAAASSLRDSQLPILVRTKHVEFPPAKALGFRIFQGTPTINDLWNRCGCPSLSPAAPSRWSNATTGGTVHVLATRHRCHADMCQGGSSERLQCAAVHAALCCAVMHWGTC